MASLTTEEWLASFCPGVDWWSKEGQAIRLRKRLEEAGLPIDQGLGSKDVLEATYEVARKRMCARVGIHESSSWAEINARIVVLRQNRDAEMENGTWEGSIFCYF